MTRIDDVDGEGQERPVSLSPADEERILVRTLGVFRGRTKGWAVLNWSMTAAWGAVGLWAALAFVRSEAVRDWIFYASAFLVSVIVVSSLKIWFWLELNRYAHTRELKRLESQVALLVQTLNQRPRS